MKKLIKFKPLPVRKNGSLDDQLDKFCKKARKNGKNGKTHIIGIEESTISRIMPMALILGFPIYADKGFRVKIL